MGIFKRSFLSLLVFFILTITVHAGQPVVIVNQESTSTVAVVNGKLSMIDSGYLNQIRESNIADHAYVRIQGFNPTVGTALEEISDLGTVGFGNWPSVAAGAILVSDSVADDTGGTGAITVIVRGLDAAFLAVNATVTMDGTTPVTITTQEFFRVEELEVVTAGTGLTNAGTIIASVGGANIIALLPGHSRSQSGRKTTKAGMTTYLENSEGSVIGTKDITFHIYTRDTQTAGAPFVLQKIWQAQDGGYFPNGKLAPILEKTDIILLGEAGAASTSASASSEGWEEE